MANDNVVPFRQPESFHDALTSLLRERAQDLVRKAVEAEFEPPRLSRRLHHLRGWSHEDQTEAVPG